MKATELRIGNWVFDSDRDDPYFYQIVRIETKEYTDWNSGDKFNVIGKIEGSEDGYYEMKPSPIPLTEEWMERFGFIRQGNRNMWVKDKLCIELKELPNIRGEFIEGWYIGLKDLGNVLFHSFMKIEHVHQLQNLYFALKGEELTLTK